MYYIHSDIKRHFSYKQELAQEKLRLKKREAHIAKLKPTERKIYPHDFYITWNTVVDDEVEIAAGFNL